MAGKTVTSAAVIAGLNKIDRRYTEYVDDDGDGFDLSSLDPGDVTKALRARLAGCVILTAAQWSAVREALDHADDCADFEEMEADDAPDEGTARGLRARVAAIRAGVAVAAAVGRG
jgi:hypothetical protein